MKLILQKLGPVTETEIQLPWVLVGETLKNMVKSTALCIHKEHFGIFFECLQVSSNFKDLYVIGSPRIDCWCSWFITAGDGIS